MIRRVLGRLMLGVLYVLACQLKGAARWDGIERRRR